jgi:hypothetical protein
MPISNCTILTDGITLTASVVMKKWHTKKHEKRRVLLANSEARIDLLRGKAGLGGGSKVKGKEKETIEDITGGTRLLIGSGGHINFFEDLEQVRYPITLLISTYLFNILFVRTRSSDLQSPRSPTLSKQKRVSIWLHQLQRSTTH